MSPEPQPVSIGRVVIYRSRTGRYDVPAIVTATEATLDPDGVASGGVPALSSPDHVHLTVLTPGMPGRRASADDFEVPPDLPISENVAGCYQEWDVPLASPAPGPYADDALPAPPGTWRWPDRV